MLDQDAIEALPERIYQRLNKLNTHVLELIGSRIGAIGQVSPTDAHRLAQLAQYGADIELIANELARISEKNVQDIYDIFETVAKDNEEFSSRFFDAAGKTHIPYADNVTLQRYVESLAKQTAQAYVNMSATTAFLRYNAAGEKVLTSLSQTYQEIIDEAITAAATSVTDYQSAMRKAIRDLADSGLRTKYRPLEGAAGKAVDYATGYSRRLDTAVRQNVLWGIKQCNQGVADLVGGQFGANGYEISYHSNPRPSHADMGGRQYAAGRGRTVNGVYYPPFSSVEGLLGDYNCYHFKFSILLGISEPAYSKKQLAALKARDAEKIEFEGKTYTRYEATQMQRQLETAARHAKDRQIIAKAAGDDTLMRTEQARINSITQKYAQFSKAAGLPVYKERMAVSGYHKVNTYKADARQPLANGGKSGILSKNRFAPSGGQLDSGYKAALEAKFNNGLLTAKSVYDKFVPAGGVAADIPGARGAFYPSTRKIHMDFSVDAQNPRGAGTTWFHEHGHFIDGLAKKVSKSTSFKQALKSDVSAYEKAVKQANGFPHVGQARYAISAELRNLGDKTHSLQDIFGGAIKKWYPGARWGHKDHYWRSSGSWGVTTEAFAHMFEASFDPEKADLMRKYLPTAWAEFEKLLGGMI